MSETVKEATKGLIIRDFMSELGQRILNGGQITRDEALELINIESNSDIMDLLSWANRIREHFKGNEMARVMSFVMAVFILVPVIALSIGQLILISINWQAIFWLFLFFSIMVLTYYIFRLPETLNPKTRRVFLLHQTFQGI